uniref:Glycosyltransferase family 1 protein n=1 Tax=Schlesneria paludicola TaxID=360056 RepID=A0A7C4LJE4_9PLAN
MRVALVILHADPARGGAERYTVDLAAELARRGMTVSLISSSAAVQVPGVATVVLSSSRPTRTGRYWDFLAQLDRHLATHHHDVVHAALPVRTCHVYHPHAGLAAEALAEGHLKRSGLARWLSRWGNRFNARRNAFAAVERPLLNGGQPPIVISLSRYVERAVDRFYCLPENRRARLFNAVDLDRFDPAGMDAAAQQWRRSLGCHSHDILALMIAQDFARKGLRETLTALSLVDDPRLKLVVVGKPDPQPWRTLAHQFGVADRAIFAGPTRQPEVCYAAADVFVLPTHHDPCSLVVLEALAMGVPVITTQRNGAAEVMTDGQEGFVLSSPDDVSSLAEALRQLCDEGLRRRMADACLRLRPQLSYAAHVDRLLTIYDRAAAATGSRTFPRQEQRATQHA